MARVLFISLKFPPNADIGAKRPLRMVRRLPRFGWTPTVLTLPVGSPGQHDPGLVELVPQDLRVERTYADGPVFRVIDRIRHAWARDVGRSTGRAEGNGRLRRALIYGAENVAEGLVVTDEWLPFVPSGAAAALRILSRGGHAAIYVCGDPSSSYLAAWIAHRRTGLPLVLDLRDPWTLDPTIRALKYPHARAVEELLESRIFADAAAVILNTRRALEAYERLYPWLDRSRLHVIHNAFDPELVRDEETDPDPVFTVMHFGHYHRFRSARVFLDGLKMFMQREGVRVRFVNHGEFVPDDLEHARRIGLGSVVEVRPPVGFRDSPRVLRRARVLLLEQRNGASLQVPGKFYDYLFAGRPVISLSRNPELEEMIARTRCGWSVDPDDPRAVADALSRARALDPERFRQGLDREQMTPYTGEDTARRLARVLDGVTCKFPACMYTPGRGVEHEGELHRGRGRSRCFVRRKHVHARG